MNPGIGLALIFLLPLAVTQAEEGPLKISSETVSAPSDLIRGTLPPSPDYTPVPWYGEKLTFQLQWGVLTLGEATLSVPEIVDFNGQPAYHILSTAKTYPFGDRFYKVRDVNESWIHVGDLRSLGYSKKLREGKFFRDEWVIFDYDNKTWLSKKVNRDASFEYTSGTLPGAVQDILSAIFMIRPEPLNVGDEVVFDVNTKKNWPLKIKVLRRTTIRVPAGRFKCIIVEPVLREEGLFIQKGKKMQVWLTDDKRHIPVMLRVDIIFGKISGYLTKMEVK